MPFHQSSTPWTFGCCCIYPDVKIPAEISKLFTVEFSSIIHKKFLQISKYFDPNSKQLFDNNFLLLLITADINQVFQFACVHSFKSIATISLNLCAIDNPTLDFVYTCLYLLQISQVSLIPAKI